MKYKLLALDIDETITTEAASTVAPAVFEVLHAASQKITITFVTARAVNRFEEFLRNLNLPAGYHVIENGAKVLDPQGNIIYDLSIPHDEVQIILDTVSPFVRHQGFLADQHWRDDVLTIHPDHTITGVSFTCESETSASQLKDALEKLPQKYALYIGKHWEKPGEWKGILLFHKDATKGNGMRFVQEKLGITKDETIAVGDGATDITMFDAAGLKVAMKNAVPEMIEAADYVAPTVSENGIIDVIRKYVLNPS